MAKTMCLFDIAWPKCKKRLLLKVDTLRTVLCPLHKVSSSAVSRKENTREPAGHFDRYAQYTLKEHKEIMDYVGFLSNLPTIIYSFTHFLDSQIPQ